MPQLMTPCPVDPADPVDCSDVFGCVPNRAKSRNRRQFLTLGRSGAMFFRLFRDVSHGSLTFETISGDGRPIFVSKASIPLERSLKKSKKRRAKTSPLFLRFACRV